MLSYILRNWDYVVLFFALANLILGIRGFVLGHVPSYISVINLLCSAWLFYLIRHYFIKD